MGQRFLLVYLKNRMRWVVSSGRRQSARGRVCEGSTNRLNIDSSPLRRNHHRRGINCCYGSRYTDHVKAITKRRRERDRRG